ncbi:hypothetical protein VAEKB19_5200047 [Vibrio aestuarianus]|nr:hypothetical protein VAEKB19_5200047 [Vibrio aestuarianus]
MIGGSECSQHRCSFKSKGYIYHVKKGIEFNPFFYGESSLGDEHYDCSSFMDEFLKSISMVNRSLAEK